MKLLLLLIICFSFFTETNAANTKLIKHESYSDQITWKHINFNLPNGEWIYYAKDPWSFQNFHGSCVNFLNIKKKLLMVIIRFVILKAEVSGEIFLALFFKQNGKKINMIIVP